MGTSTDAHCYAFGTDHLIWLGGGFLNFLTFDAWPVRCARCPGIVATNLMSDPHTCVECGSSDVAFFEEAFGGPAEATEWARLKAANQNRGGIADHFAPVARDADASTPTEAWKGYALWKGRYLCPYCGEPQLRFGTYFNHGPIDWD